MMNITMSGTLEGDVGSVVFVEAPKHLDAERTAEGFKITFPIEVTLKCRGSWLPMIANLRGLLSASFASGSPIEIGRLVEDLGHSYIAPVTKGRSLLRWCGGLRALQLYEKERAGRPVKFRMSFATDVYLVPKEGPPVRDSCVPWHFSGTEEISYPIEVWSAALRKLRVAEIVMVEIPLPSDPPNGWDEVWGELSIARAELERGGSTAWRGCATGVRRALEEWRKMEEERNASTKAPKERTKEERLDDLRLCLKNYADLTVHTPAEHWSREEAALMLAGLSALLAVRKP